VDIHQKEKLASCRNILVNSAIGINLFENEKEFILHWATTLSVLYIQILKFMAHPLQYLEAHGDLYQYIMKQKR